MKYFQTTSARTNRPRLQKFVFLFAIVICSCSTENESKQLNGTWIPIKEEIGGTAFPESAFSDQRLIIEDENYTMRAENVDKGTVTLDGNKITIEGKEGPNAGRQIKAIYKIENEELTICYNLAGDIFPKTFSTEGNSMFFMATFKRAE